MKLVKRNSEKSNISFYLNFEANIKKQPLRAVPGKGCSEHMQQIFRRTPMPKCDFNKVASFIEITLRHGCSVSLLHIFRASITKNTSGWLLLNVCLKV